MRFGSSVAAVVSARRVHEEKIANCKWALCNFGNCSAGHCTFSTTFTKWKNKLHDIHFSPWICTIMWIKSIWILSIPWPIYPNCVSGWKRYQDVCKKCIHSLRANVYWIEQTWVLGTLDDDDAAQISLSFHAIKGPSEDTYSIKNGYDRVRISSTSYWSPLNAS